MSEHGHKKNSYAREEVVVAVVGFVLLVGLIFLLVRKSNQLESLTGPAVVVTETVEPTATPHEVPVVETDTTEPTIPPDIARPQELPTPSAQRRFPNAATFNEIARKAGCPDVQAQNGQTVQDSLEQLLNCLSKKQ